MRWTLALLFVAACGPKVHMDDSPFEEDDPRAGAPAEEPAAPVWEQLPEAPAGPGPILSHMDVTAEHAGNRFVGWRLVAFDPQHRDFDGVDLRPGDVLVALNGIALVKPDDLETVWEQLRDTDVIVADLIRDGARFQLTWTVTSPQTAPPTDH